MSSILKSIHPQLTKKWLAVTTVGILAMATLHWAFVYAGYRAYQAVTPEALEVTTQLHEPRVGKSTAHLAAEQPKQEDPVPVVTAVVAQKPTEATNQLSLSNAVSLFQSKLGVKLVMVRSAGDLQNSGLGYGGLISASNSDDATVLAVVTMIYNEWGKYPSGFLGKVGLKQVAIVGGINNSGYQVAAMPRAEDLDVVYYSTNFGTDTYMKRVAHHELDHLIEYNAYGTYYYNDATYKACNSPDFTYSSSGIDAYTGKGISAYALHPSVGLIDGYSTYGIEEDKAQIYTELFANIGFLNGLTASDTRLTCKKNAYLAFLQTFDSSITEGYLQKLTAIPSLLN